MTTNTPLKIVLACSELTPLAKTGGLADVSAALSNYFDAAGHELRVLMPYYATIDTAGLEIEIVPELQELELQMGDRTVPMVEQIVSSGAAEFHRRTNSRCAAKGRILPLTDFVA